MDVSRPMSTESCNTVVLLMVVMLSWRRCLSHYRHRKPVKVLETACGRSCYRSCVWLYIILYLRRHTQEAGTHTETIIGQV